MLKVAAYCRVSTDHDDQLNSLESQKRFFDEYINRNAEWVLVHIYADEGLSGTSTKKRKAFNAMITDAENGKIDLILTKEISRFARNTLDSIFYTRKLKDLGVGVIFLNDNINTLDPDSELRLTIMSSIAQEESRRTSQRVTWGQKRQMESGVAFGTQMLGYHLKDGKLTIIEDEAELVKRIFHMYLYEKKSLNAIALELESKGILTKQKCKTWSPARIQKILRNEKYAGYLAQGRTYTVDYLTHKKSIRNDDELIVVDNTHDAIISKEEFEQVQAELDRRCSKRENQKRYSNRYPFSGKLVCGECGSTFVSRNRYDEKRFVKRWQCYKYYKYGRPSQNEQGEQVGCNSFIMRDEILQQVFTLAVNEVVKNKGGIISEIMQVLDEVMKNNSTPDEQSRLQKELEKSERKKQSLIELYLDGTITKNDMTAVTDTLEKQIQELKEQLKSYNSYSLKQNDFERLREGMTNRINSITGGETFSEEVCQTILDKIVIHSKTNFDVFLKGSENGFFFADSGCILYPRQNFFIPSKRKWKS